LLKPPHIGSLLSRRRRDATRHVRAFAPRLNDRRRCRDRIDRMRATDHHGRVGRRRHKHHSETTAKRPEPPHLAPAPRRQLAKRPAQDLEPPTSTTESTATPTSAADLSFFTP
jgi:hypothetical protein